MTSFLYSPLMGFMLVCGIDRISNEVYAACSDILMKVMFELQKLFLRSKTVSKCNELALRNQQKIYFNMLNSIFISLRVGNSR